MKKIIGVIMYKYYVTQLMYIDKMLESDFYKQSKQVLIVFPNGSEFERNYYWHDLKHIKAEKINSFEGFRKIVYSDELMNMILKNEFHGELLIFFDCGRYIPKDPVLITSFLLHSREYSFDVFFVAQNFKQLGSSIYSQVNYFIFFGEISENIGYLKMRFCDQDYKKIQDAYFKTLPHHFNPFDQTDLEIVDLRETDKNEQKKINLWKILTRYLLGKNHE
jgi:hypothetical protein